MKYIFITKVLNLKCRNIQYVSPIVYIYIRDNKFLDNIPIALMMHCCIILYNK